MTLYDLLNVINWGVALRLFDNNQEDLGLFYAHEDVPDEYEDCEVNDVFTENNELCIEIERGDENDE